MDIKHLINNTPIVNQWHAIGIRHHHGIALPLGALRTSKSCGVGEYLDLLPLINWCREIGLDIIQLLPLNDSGQDPSPYNALSSIALNPIYLSLHALPFLEHHPHLVQKLKDFSPLNNTERVEYQEVLHKKESWLKEYFDCTQSLLLTCEDYVQFSANNPWAKEFSLYKTLKMSMTFGTWEEWPDPLRHPTEEKKNELYEIHKSSIIYYSILQFLCHQQLQKVKNYATDQGVFLKGDIPILISPDSADVWLHQKLFNLNVAVGYPPDVFNEEGQLWGFPGLNWDVMQQMDFQWWKTRLQVCSQYYHLYRLDHIAGFYKLWLIPKGKKSIDGCYHPALLQEAICAGHEHLLAIIPTCPMLPIGEDLGNIEQEIFDSLRALGIPGTRVIRWERNWKDDGHFTPYHHYHPLSMTCVSTHDSEPLTLWWEKYPAQVKDFCQFKHWRYTKHLSKQRRYQILYDAHHSSSLFHINLLQEYLAFFPALVHKDPQQERINIPGFVLPSNWTYRFVPTLEEIISHRGLKNLFKSLISSFK